MFLSVVLDIDFSENPILNVKHEPQALQWAKQKVAVHNRNANQSDQGKNFAKTEWAVSGEKANLLHEQGQWFKETAV